MLVTSISIFLFVLLIGSLVSEDKSYFIALLIVQTFFSSYLSVNLEYAFEGGVILYVLKSWREFILVILFIATLAKIAKGYQLQTLKFFKFDLLLLVIVFHLLSLIYAIVIKHNSPFSAINESRFYFVGLYLILFCYYNFNTGSLNYDIILMTIFILISINVLYASYNYVTFDGYYQNSWRYQFKFEREFLKLKESYWGFRLLGNDFVRAGNLRASGFFISTLEYAITLAYVFIIAFITYLNKLARLRSLALVIMPLCLLGIYTSQTRTAYGIVILSIVIYVLLVKYKKKLSTIIFLPLLFTFFVFGAIVFRVPGLDESSSLGRIVQYVEFFQNFSFFGVGWGSSLRTAFDSLYLSTFVVFGIFGTFYLVLIFYPVKNLHWQISRNMGNLDSKGVLVLSTLIFLITSIFVLSVQYSIYSFQLFMLMLLGYFPLKKLTV